MSATFGEAAHCATHWQKTPCFCIPRKTDGIISWQELADIVLRFDDDENGLDGKSLATLSNYGAALGGARPKVILPMGNGDEWILKFPSKHDEFDIGAWELVAYSLARLCGLRVMPAKEMCCAQRGKIFAVKRFDRAKGTRIHFASALTLLGMRDGEPGAGYLDILEFIQTYGAEPAQDAEELWKRMVFNILISNTDDHLRNHGFLLIDNMWRLSPLYDVNPNPTGAFLSLDIAPGDNRKDLALAEETAEFYGMNLSRARQTIDCMAHIVNRELPSLASRYGISLRERRRMAAAFALSEERCQKRGE